MSGIHMGDFDQETSYDQGNMFEMIETLNINKKILNCEDMHSLSIIKPFNPEKLSVETELEIKNLINNKSNKYENWGFKDPRTCLTYSTWKKYLPEHKIIVVYREPSELWNHYKPKTLKSLLWRGFRKCWRAIRAWYIYNISILKILENNEPKNFLVLNYSKLMTSDDEFNRIKNFVNHEIRDARIKKLYRSRNKRDVVYLIILFCQSLIFRRNVKKLYSTFENNYS
jgi:hypothetical protein